VSTGMPSSDVLQWRLEEGSLVTVRPSGTEPKIKYYACVPESAGKGLEEAKRRAQAKMAAIEADIRKIVGN
jgi:phosphoglucomutase